MRTVLVVGPLPGPSWVRLHGPAVPRSIEKRRRVARAVAGGAWMVLFDAEAVTNAGKDVATFVRAVGGGYAP